MLSRTPVFSATELEEDPRDIEDTIQCLRISNDLVLDIITEATVDNVYTKAAAELLQTGKHATLDESSLLHEYTSSLSTLSISELKGSTLLIIKDIAKVVPKLAQSKKYSRVTSSALGY